MTKMKKQGFLSRYLLLKPTIRVMIEWPILLFIGILGEIFSWPKIPFSPFSNLIGIVIFIGGWVFHQYCHTLHKQAHKSTHEVNGLIKTGVFSKIRHPMYLSLILMYLGVTLAWGIVWMLIPLILFSVFFVLTINKEEELLLERFGHHYEEYKKSVPWRLIPWLF